MADNPREETQSIRDSTKALKKYGSTCNHFKRQEHFIKHVISEGDTLQGIALKYGVTMEQIRRVNRLWASDSLFLREMLLIPVPLDLAMNSSNNQLLFDVNSVHSPGTPDSSQEEESSISDFLVKIDTSIANTKSQVKKSQGNSEFRADDDDLTVSRCRPPKSRLRQQLTAQSTHGTHNDMLSAPHPVVMTQGRKVRSSLQRLEKETDEMFEL
ncbi:lysM and putative peptidoglycan-binding domain-containing protein 2 [Anabrus simplex]|uniref:lysM and putative peptidoglycan-binding domain-containing protein 2 n=1 Tax=Anabrus simplex TaxID=316456 RepID=UPI0034DD34E8